MVRWVRGHPERRKPRDEWTVEEVKNDWVDRAADQAYKMEWEWGSPSEVLEEGEVAVWAGGRQMCGKLRK